MVEVHMQVGGNKCDSCIWAGRHWVEDEFVKRGPRYLIIHDVQGGKLAYGPEGVAITEEAE